MIIHWDFVVCAFQVGVRGIDSEAFAAGPRDLQNVQEDHRGSNGRRKLTAASLRGVGAGALAAYSASKPRASKAVRPVGRNISLGGVIPMVQIHTYMGPMGAEHCGSVSYGNLRYLRDADCHPRGLGTAGPLTTSHGLRTRCMRY